MKKKTILSAVLTAIFMNAGLYGQQKEISPELQQVLDKLEMLGQQNPAGAFPIDKLTEEEKQIYLPYEREMHEKYIRENPIIPTAEANRATNKAFGHDTRNNKFGWISLAAPAVNVIQTGYTQQFHADDIAGNGLLYYADNTNKTLYVRNADGSSTPISTFKNIVNNQNITGLSWNPVNSTMYLVSNTAGEVSNLYTLNLANATATLLGTFGTTDHIPIWLEIDNNGMGYFAEINSDNLYSLNLGTRQIIQRGPLGVNIQFAQDADFNRETNELYAALYQGAAVGPALLTKINTQTGAATILNYITGEPGETIEYSAFSLTNTIPYMATEETAKLSYKIYPNPATDFITVESKEKLSGMMIYDANGRNIRSEKMNGQNHQIDVRSLTPGVYWLKISSDRNSESIRFIKK